MSLFSFMRKLGGTCTRGFIPVALALSFLATIVPVRLASAAEEMPCCAGHDKGSCSSGLAAKVRHDKEGPFANVDAGIHAPGTSVFDAASFNRPAFGSQCRGECGTCSANFLRQRFGEQTAPPKTTGTINATSPLGSVEHFQTDALTNFDFALADPRGPPTQLP